MLHLAGQRKLGHQKHHCATTNSHPNIVMCVSLWVCCAMKLSKSIGQLINCFNHWNKQWPIAHLYPPLADDLIACTILMNGWNVFFFLFWPDWSDAFRRRQCSTKHFESLVLATLLNDDSTTLFHELCRWIPVFALMCARIRFCVVFFSKSHRLVLSTARSNCPSEKKKHPSTIDNKVCASKLTVRPPCLAVCWICVHWRIQRRKYEGVCSDVKDFYWWIWSVFAITTV